MSQSKARFRAQSCRVSKILAVSYPVMNQLDTGAERKTGLGCG